MRADVSMIAWRRTSRFALRRESPVVSAGGIGARLAVHRRVTWLLQHRIQGGPWSPLPRVPRPAGSWSPGMANRRRDSFPAVPPGVCSTQSDLYGFPRRTKTPRGHGETCEWSRAQAVSPSQRHEAVIMTLAQTTAADMNWFAVLAHHAARTPDKTITVFEGEATT